MSYLSAREYKGLGEVPPSGVAIHASGSRVSAGATKNYSTEGGAVATPVTPDVPDSVRFGHGYKPPMNSMEDKLSYKARNTALISAGLMQPLGPMPAGSSATGLAPSGAVATPSGYMIPASTVVAAPPAASGSVSPAIAAIPGGGTTETFDYGAATGAPAEEFDYGGPTGAPTEEYGDAAETPAVNADYVPESSGLPAAAVLALAGAAIGLGPIGIGLAAAAGFVFGKG